MRVQSFTAKRGKGTAPPGLAKGEPEDRLRGVEGADDAKAAAKRLSMLA